MRTNFRALIRKAGKDAIAVKAIAREQAAFSSQREMTCRDYDQETVHGFCSTQITEARALDLLAQFGAIEPPPGDRRSATYGKKGLPPGRPALAADPPRLLPTMAPNPHPGPPAGPKAPPAAAQATPESSGTAPAVGAIR
jgi:hypothetical protein